MNYNIRRREKNDCKEIAHVVTVAWNETYKGIVPDEFLDNLYKNEEERTISLINNFDVAFDILESVGFKDVDVYHNRIPDFCKIKLLK